MLSFVVEGLPQTKGSWRPKGRNRHTGRIVLVPDNPDELAWAQTVAWAARGALRGPPKPDRRRYRVGLAFLLPAPSGRGGRRGKRDLDKLMRSVLDALTGIIWLDDEQVDCATLAKGIGPNPGLEVKIEALTEM